MPERRIPLKRYKSEASASQFFPEATRRGIETSSFVPAASKRTEREPFTSVSGTKRLPPLVYESDFCSTSYSADALAVSDTAPMRCIISARLRDVINDESVKCSAAKDASAFFESMP